jgi:hypothetical protein
VPLAPSAGRLGQLLEFSGEYLLPFRVLGELPLNLGPPLREPVDDAVYRQVPAGYDKPDPAGRGGGKLVQFCRDRQQPPTSYGAHVIAFILASGDEPRDLPR